MAFEKCFLLLFVFGMFVLDSIAWDNRLPGESYGTGDGKVRDFGKKMGDQMRARDSNTLWEKGKLSAGKGAVGYSFDNGAKAFVGKNGLGYDFGARKKLSFNPMNQELKYKSNNGAEVYQRPTDDGWKAGLKWKF